MAGIAIPHDRTTKQPVRGYCYNPECREDSRDERYEFTVEQDCFACPKCGGDTPPRVGLLVLVHLLIEDAKGPIVGALGLRYRLGCDERRAYLATVTNLEAATGLVSAANCPGCLAEHVRLKLPHMTGQAVTPPK